MKNSNKAFTISFLLILILMINCSNSSEPKDFDYGKIENDRYTNSYFDLELNLPSHWIVQTKEQTENLTKIGKDLVAGDNKNMRAAFNASEINTANLLTVFQYEVGSAVDFNPGFMLMAENLKAFPGIKTGSDYLFQVRRAMKQSQFQYDSIDDEFKKIIIDNQEYYLMNTSVSYAGYTIRQEYYSTLQDGFCISAIISYNDDEQKSVLKKVINSMKFKK